MNKQTYFQHLRSFFDEGLKLMESKNADYAGKENPFRNFEASENLGISREKGILIRIQDKISRVNNLLDADAKVKDESIRDTLIDLANYAAILSASLEQRKETTKLIKRDMLKLFIAQEDILCIHCNEWIHKREMYYQDDDDPSKVYCKKCYNELFAANFFNIT